MEAKFGNGTFLVQDLQVMYRMGITLYCAFLRRFVYACKYIYSYGGLNFSVEFGVKFNVEFSQFKPPKSALNSTTKTWPTQEAPGA